MATPAIAQVIKKEFCIGCGACSSINPAMKVEAASNGEFRVLTIPQGVDLKPLSRVCPLGDAPDEDELAEKYLPHATSHSPGIGRFIDLYAGHSTEWRSEGGSGGLTRWLISKLLQRGRVEHVVHVARSARKDGVGDLFAYTIASSADEYLTQTSSSAYYPVTLQNVIQVLRELDGRCIVTAVPCFSRALRSLMNEDAALKGKVHFISGVICGSLKSRRYAEYLALQMGVRPPELERVNFRGKSLARRANEKCVEAWAGYNEPAVARVQDLKGTNYGEGYFKPKACDYCDDVLAETADVAFGDAWIPPYADNPAGTNVVVVRNPEIAAIFRDAAASGQIQLDRLTPEQVEQSQAGGLRHRRDGLRVRLFLSKLFGQWVPKKRITPSFQLRQFIIQVPRILMRKVTSSPSVPVTSPAFEPLTIVAAKIMRASTLIAARLR
jgi:coenzyme F420 hydrogenase subunit beta